MIPDGTTHEQWEKIGSVLTELTGASTWMLGDWLCHGQKYHPSGQMFDGVYAKVAADTGYAVQTLMNAKSVCLAIPLSRRREGLSYHHAVEIAGRAPLKDYDKWIKRATEPGVTVKQLRKELREAKAIYKPEENDTGVASSLTITDGFVRDMMALEPGSFRLALKQAHLKNLQPVLLALKS